MGFVCSRWPLIAATGVQARRRQYHENHQDFLKRKAQEKGRSKMREARERFLETYADAHRAAAPPPAFGDMFFYDEQNAVRTGCGPGCICIYLKAVRLMRLVTGAGRRLHRFCAAPGAAKCKWPRWWRPRWRPHE